MAGCTAAANKLARGCFSPERAFASQLLAALTYEACPLKPTPSTFGGPCWVLLLYSSCVDRYLGPFVACRRLPEASLPL